MSKSLPKKVEEALGRLSHKTGARRLSTSADPVLSGADSFMNAAWALLGRSRLACAICGDKSALKEREDAYYEAFYTFAEKKADLAVVRVFGNWTPTEAKPRTRQKTHNEKNNVLGLWAKDRSAVHNLMDEPGFGLVLFRGPFVTTALLHWGGDAPDFRWTASSDPVMTTVLSDAWRGLAETAEPPKGGASQPHRDELAAFCRRFGMAEPP